MTTPPPPISAGQQVREHAAVVNAAMRDRGVGRYHLAIRDLQAAAIEEHEQTGDARRLFAIAGYRNTALGEYRPLPQALAFHKSQAAFRWALGGNRSSKSHALAVDTLWTATGMHPFQPDIGPAYGWYCTTTWDEVGKTLYREKLKQLLVGIDHSIVWYNKSREIPYEIVIPRRGYDEPSRIAFKAYEQGRRIFQAASLNFANFDEQFPQDVFVETLTRIGPGKRLRFAAAMTPIEPQPWLEEKLNSGGELPKGYEVFEFPLDDNRVSAGGFIDDDLVDATIAEWPPEVRDTRRKGKWGSYLGSIFQTFDRTVHVVDEAKERAAFFQTAKKPGTLPYNWRAILSVDWGGANPFVVLFGCRVPHLDDDWYIFDELYWDFSTRGQRRLDEFAEDVKKKIKSWDVMLAHGWADHDPTNALMFQKYGVPTRPAVKDVTAGIETVQAKLNPRLHLVEPNLWPKGRPGVHIAKRCSNLLRELPSYKWQKGTDIRDPRPEPMKVNDHAVDACRYLLHSESPYDGKGGKMRVDLGRTNRRTF